MDVIKAIKERKSIRKFKPDPVPKKIIREILETAVRAPSGMNTQPWEFAVLAGDVIEKVKQANMDLVNSSMELRPGNLSDDKPPDTVYRRRQVELARMIFKLMDIPREDVEKRAQWLKRGFRFFDAPAAIIIMIDSSLPVPGPLLDIGAVMQTICLAAMNYGLGTCIESQGVSFPGVLRRYAKIPESKRMIISIAIGYPDFDFPANRLESTRESVDSATTWDGF
jgi:nitroreductase